MGVKDLWTILDPIADETSLELLYDKAVAIDLSAWICDSNAMGQNHRNIQRPDLRNTFFRASRLIFNNVKPIFITDGEAPELKHATIRHRNALQRPQSQSQSQKPPRSQFQSRMKPLLRLLDAMGLPCVQSSGEAEKLCAQLNKEGTVDAVISQDSDCLLYGASTVLRHFSVAKGTATARRYQISEATTKLGLNRESLIVLAILLGCDYAPGGVSGVGREAALGFLSGLDKDVSPLDRIRSWRCDKRLIKLEKERVEMSQPRICPECWHPGTALKHCNKGCEDCGSVKGCYSRESILKAGTSQSKWQLIELQIRNKALQDPNFPSEEIIEEFLSEDSSSSVSLKWKEPNFKTLLEISIKQLGWDRESSVEKILQLVSRWQCHKLASKPLITTPLPLEPSSLIKFRVQHGIKCVEVKWTHGRKFPVEFQDDIAPLTTLEPVSLFSQAFPVLYQTFEDSKLVKKKTTKTRTVKEKVTQKCDKCGHVIVAAGHLCRQFLALPKSKPTHEFDLEEMFSELELDESMPEHELSGILNSIVCRNKPNIPKSISPITVLENSVMEISSEVKHDTTADMSIETKENIDTLGEVDYFYYEANVSFPMDYNDVSMTSTPQNSKFKKDY